MIDANCLLHPMCFKVLGENPHITNLDKLERKMINQVIEYIDTLVKYVDPKKTVYLAIDGVAPIAKIKQQRTRRFKSVHDKELFDNIKKKHNKELSNYWNNSAITPGTVFMEKLKVQILNLYFLPVIHHLKENINYYNTLEKNKLKVMMRKQNMQYMG